MMGWVEMGFSLLIGTLIGANLALRWVVRLIKRFESKGGKILVKGDAIYENV